MTYRDEITLVDNKIDEIVNQLADMKRRVKAGDLSENTLKTQTQLKMTTLKHLHVIYHLLQDMMEFTPSDVEHEWLNDCDKYFVSITTLTEERKATQVTVKEGDNILELLQKYDGTRDLMTKLTKACEKVGCKMDMANNKIVKA